MYKKIYIPILTLILTLILTACSSNSQVNSNKLQVYTTIFPITDIVTKIGGDKIDVHPLLQNNSDAHSFEPTAKNISNLENAHFLFYNGVGLETWVDSIKNSINSKELSFVDLSQNINLLEGDESLHFEKNTAENAENTENSNNSYLNYHDKDPHIWLSPSNVLLQASIILENLIAKDPENQNYYNQNYNEVLSKLEKLNADYLNTLSTVPKKELIVTHPAYDYMLQGFNIKQIPISQNSESLDVSPAKLLDIINYIEKNSIQYIVTDNNSNKKIVETIKAETGVDILTLNTMEVVSEEDILNNKDYFSIMYENLDVLKKALS